MNALVASASRHGATREIADLIGATLADRGIATDIREIDNVCTLVGYDAVVIGSAVYMGDWISAARTFVERHAGELAERPTWLFSSGPIGSPPHPAAEDAFDVADLIKATRAREHHLFGGKLDKHELGLAERALAGALRVPGGDYREWDAVAAWATAIARTLRSEVPA